MYSKSRVGRREQICQQEKLIEQRKQEIENKLKLLETKPSVSTDDTPCDLIPNNNADPELSPPNETTESSPESVVSTVNKFANDGSFFEQFLKMQKSVPKDISEPNKSCENIETKAIIKPIKMIVKETKSKLKATEEVEESTVKLDDDIKEDKEIISAIERTAISVTMNGSEAEETMRQSKASEAQDVHYSWLNDKDSNSYKYFHIRVQQLSEAKARAQNDTLPSNTDDEMTNKGIKRQRKSRWGEEKVEVKPDLALVQYALQVFGSIDLSEEQWKQLEDQRKMKMLCEMLKQKQMANDKLLEAGKVKYEYDSDEDTTDGTWEHKRRRQEMSKTQILAQQLTESASGKHHIGDFMPPEELEKFMHKWEALKEGKPLTPESDYKDAKIESDNIGFQMLKKLGWQEGQGLGSDNSGIADPINKTCGGVNNAGLGLTRPDDLKEGDDEFEAYRKRMMMAYRFRPNPMNNPRREYY